jgi:hypothetical protein
VSTVWLVEARRHLGPFAAAITVGGLLGAARLLFTPVTFDVFFQLFSMLAWTVLAGYAFSVVYGYFFLGRDVFLHLGHRSPARATALKMAVQIAYLFMLFCWLLVFNALWMAHVGTDEMPVVLTYYVTARVASLACFAAVVLAIIAVVKRIHGKTVALISALVMYAVVTGGSRLLDVVDDASRRHHLGARYRERLSGGQPVRQHSPDDDRLAHRHVRGLRLAHVDRPQRGSRRIGLRCLDRDDAPRSPELLPTMSRSRRVTV